MGRKRTLFLVERLESKEPCGRYKREWDRDKERRDSAMVIGTKSKEQRGSDNLKGKDKDQVGHQR